MQDVLLVLTISVLLFLVVAFAVQLGSLQTLANPSDPESAEFLKAVKGFSYPAEWYAGYTLLAAGLSAGLTNLASGYVLVVDTFILLVAVAVVCSNE